jgi:hypothetical protein
MRVSKARLFVALMRDAAPQRRLALTLRPAALHRRRRDDAVSGNSIPTSPSAWVSTQREAVGSIPVKRRASGALT